MKDIWKESKYFDLWSINHLLSGGVLAGLFILFGLKFGVGLLISFVLMLTWELYEFFGPIKERISNQAMDMIEGVLGFLIAYPLILNSNFISRIVSFSILTFLFLFLEIWGFLAYKKRNR